MFRARFVLSQLGPLYFVGLLDRRHLSHDDIKAWSASELHPDGGTIAPIAEWRPGQNVTLAFMQEVHAHQRWVLDRFPKES